MTITAQTISEMVEIVAGLVAQGVTFEAAAHPRCEGYWLITLTGGF